jgi:prepilin-type N-terminal cleavage/methylation domain-containing protein
MRLKFNHSKKNNYHPYSLIEMLIVLAIIALLFAMGAGGYTAGRRWLSKTRTEALLAKLKIAIEAYKNDKGYYPQPHNSVTNFRLDINVKDFADVNPSGYASDLPASIDHLQPRNNMNKFMDFGKIKADQSLKVPNSKYNEYFVKDGWNAPAGSENFAAIKYLCPGVINTTSFDLYSVAFA